MEYDDHLYNPKVHCRVQKSPLLLPLLSQVTPVHTLTPASLIYISILFFCLYAYVFQVVSSLQISRLEFFMNFSSLPRVSRSSLPLYKPSKKHNQYTFTLKKSTAMSDETLDNLQHLTRPIPENWSSTLNSSRENLRASIETNLNSKLSSILLCHIFWAILYQFCEVYFLKS
jgi:hypothetical protein